MTTPNQLTMQKTLLGWIVAGGSNETQTSQVITATLSNPEDSLDHLLRKFWEIEETESASPKLSEEEKLCESHFENTTVIDHTGRFKVRLPFKRSPSILGNSFRAAATRLHSMEKRFNRNDEFAVMYKTFMSEYIALNHMKAINGADEKSNGYFLPHHGVIKNSSTTTKLRVVFDGSAKTTTGSSLNDCLAVGPTVQSTLYDILCRFRMFKIAFTADVEKMFRQVLVADEDTKYQRILWRDSPDKPFTTYELKTVVYGTASASYLATRALNEAAAKCQESLPDTTEEIRCLSTHVQLRQPNFIDDLIKRISSFNKISRVLAYILRFTDRKLKLSTSNLGSPYLLSQELHKAQRIIFKQIQLKYFELEINLIASNKEIPASSKLKYLNPFLDEYGILRVGGRITNASITYAIKYPLILPAGDVLTELIVREHHLRYLHAGQSLMIATLRQKYWILGCKQIVKKVVHGCIKCVRYKAENMNQVMGNLPNPRVELVRPFFKVGVDYAGPFQTRLVKGRGQKTYKSYICIFVCLATKAVHIELVSELTTESYIAALRRFISRRGICKEIHSDNGTNFIGARNQLYELYNLIRQNNNTISKFLLTDEITFKFIPPSAPHFGGLWEAAVKRVKYHLKRVTDGHTITTEEMATLLAEIEAILNSRPICVLSTEDLEYLTPAHFLIGRPTTQLPTDDLQDVKMSKLSRWQMIQKMNQDVWKRWHLEYLTNLQHRSKWHKKENNCKIDDIVLVKENNLPPSKWLIGRITDVHPGTDNMIRVVTLKTTNGVIKRPIHKLCLLPLN